MIGVLKPVLGVQKQVVSHY